MNVECEPCTQIAAERRLREVVGELYARAWALWHCHAMREARNGWLARGSGLPVALEPFGAWRR